MASAIDLVVQTARMRDGVRRVTEMVELAGLEGDVFSLNPLFTYKFEGENLDGKLMGTFEPSNLRPRFLSRLDYFGLADAFMATMKPLRTAAA
jgi:pilus assembly protein CpaF